MNSKNKRSVPNGFLGLIVLVIFISGIATMLVSGHRISEGAAPDVKPSQPSSSGSSDSDSLTGLSSQAASPNAFEDRSNLPSDYRLITVLNEDVFRGQLILVNYKYQSMIDGENLVNIYDNASSTIGVKDDDMFINESVVDPLNKLFDDFAKEKGQTSILISSSYRSKEDQTKIYNDSVKATGAKSTAYYVSVPGFSEHQTGYAFDTAAHNYNGEMIELHGHGDFEWLSEHCMDYGFILRYPSDKTNITGIGYEAWHFRYVGIPHATFIMNQKICLEEYIEGMKDYTFEKGGLLIDNGKSKWVAYYMPRLEAFNNTDIPVPTDSSTCPYTISGNNIDGFIVTVDVTKDADNSLLKNARSDWKFDNSELIIKDFEDYDPELDTYTDTEPSSDDWESDPFWGEDEDSTETDAEDYDSRFDYVDYYDEYDNDYSGDGTSSSYEQ